MATAQGLRERKKLRTSSTIGKVTLELVIERGFEAVRIDDICEAAEISRSTFFRYFDSKEASYVAGLHEGRLDTLVELVLGRPAEEGPFEALVNAIIEDSAGWKQRRDLIVLDAEIRAASPAVEARANSEVLMWQSAFADAIQERVQADTSRDIVALVIAAAVVCGMRLGTDQWLDDGARRSPVTFFRRVFAAVEQAIRL